MHRDQNPLLLDLVRGWFNDPEQIRHYQQEASSGFTALEADILRKVTTGAVLDIGCGAGRVALPLARKGLTVTGVDVSAPLLGSARRGALEQELNVSFVQVGADRLPFAADSFDVVIAFKIIGYVPSKAGRARYLDEIARVLKPDGVLLLSSHVVPDHEAARSALAGDEAHCAAASRFTSLERLDTFPEGKGFVHWFTLEELLSELSTDEFTVEDHHLEDGGLEVLTVIRRQRRASDSPSGHGVPRRAR